MSSLSARELELLSMMAGGASNQAIADELVLSPKTVETHIRTIYLKLDLGTGCGLHRRVAAVLMYVRAGGGGVEPEVLRPTAQVVPIPVHGPIRDGDGRQRIR